MSSVRLVFAPRDGSAPHELSPGVSVVHTKAEIDKYTDTLFNVSERWNCVLAAMHVVSRTDSFCRTMEVDMDADADAGCGIVMSKLLRNPRLTVHNWYAGYARGVWFAAVSKA